MRDHVHLKLERAWEAFEHLLVHHGRRVVEGVIVDDPTPQGTRQLLGTCVPHDPLEARSQLGRGRLQVGDDGGSGAEDEGEDKDKGL